MIDRKTDNQKNKDADGKTDIQRRHTDKKNKKKTFRQRERHKLIDRQNNTNKLIDRPFYSYDITDEQTDTIAERVALLLKITLNLKMQV